MASDAIAQSTVLLVDDHALLRTGVANIINQEPDLHVIAEAGNGAEAIEAYDRHHPDVTLLDLRMPIMEGVEVVRRIRDRDPAARVIVLTTYDTDDEISRALKASPLTRSANLAARLGGMHVSPECTLRMHSINASRAVSFNR